MPDPPSSRPRKRDDVVFRRVAGDWLLFDPHTRRIHVLNLSAALVWSFCTGEHESGEIAEEVADAFAELPGEGDGPAAGLGEVRRTVDEVLDRFRREGLLEGDAR